MGVLVTNKDLFGSMYHKVGDSPKIVDKKFQTFLGVAFMSLVHVYIAM